MSHDAICWGAGNCMEASRWKDSTYIEAGTPSGRSRDSIIRVSKDSCRLGEIKAYILCCWLPLPMYICLVVRTLDKSHLCCPVTSSVFGLRNLWHISSFRTKKASSTHRKREWVHQGQEAKLKIKFGLSNQESLLKRRSCTKTISIPSTPHWGNREGRMRQRLMLSRTS